MASHSMQSNGPTGNFQRPVQLNHSSALTISPVKISGHSSSSSTPFFLKRPSISSELASRLIPIDVDIHTKKNMDEHSTSHYDIPGLVLRRGQPFSFTVTFNRDFDAEQYQIYVRLAIGARSMISKGTQIRLLVDATSDGNGWSARKIFIDGEEDKKKNNRLSLQIDSPSEAIIGKYTLLLEVRPIKKDDTDASDRRDLTLFLFEVDIYFLFNPWKKEDACALSSPEQIAEYVMNEHGQIFLGKTDKPRPIPWYFGQFERSALQAALTLLDNAQLPPQNRADPSVILRILASRICSNPGANNGVFSSSFNVRPVTPEKNGLTSSTAILKHYLASNCRSVHGGSGNNWQHAAILCTLSRALGIPCRIVTVYNSACRPDGTANNDIHWDTKQRPLQKLNSDLICSSYVWNECWMRRSDLPNNEQDWQIIDSTPVPMCDGIRRTGPCPVSALKKGELGFRWDSPYIHSAVNGNKSHWVVYPDGYMEVIDVEENVIGTKIITRSLTNEFEPEDITERYKNPAKTSEGKSTLNTQSKNDINFELLIPENNRFGESITLVLNAHNKSDEPRSITTALTVCIASGSGPKSASYLDQPVQILNLESGKDDNIQFKIKPQLYMKYGPQENIVLKYFINAQIKETGQIFTRDDSILFAKDDVAKPILNEDVIEIGKPVLMKIQIANTLSRPLHNGRIYIDGLGLNQMMRVNRSFAPKESSTLRIRLHPTRVGVSRLYITFIADCLCSSTQSIPLEITRDPIKKPETLTKKTDETPTQSDELQTKASDEPSEKSDELLTKASDEPSEKSDELTEKQEESPAKPDESPKKTDAVPEMQEESPKKQDEPPVKPDEPPVKPDEPPVIPDELPVQSEKLPEKQEEPPKKPDDLPEKPEEPPKKPDETPKKQDEPSEKSDESSGKQDDASLQTVTDVTPKSDEKSEAQGTLAQSMTLDHHDDISVSDEQKTIATTPSSAVVDESNDSKPSSDVSQTKSDLSSTEHKEEVADPDDLHPTINPNTTVPHGSSLSVDKDKISVDSLDMANDRRQPPNTTTNQ